LIFTLVILSLLLRSFVVFIAVFILI